MAQLHSGSNTRRALREVFTSGGVHFALCAAAPLFAGGIQQLESVRQNSMKLNFRASQILQLHIPGAYRLNAAQLKPAESKKSELKSADINLLK